MSNAVPKDVKYHSDTLDKQVFDQLIETCDSREGCRNYFYSRFSGIEYMDNLKFRDIRDYLLTNEKDEMKKFHIPSRTWKMELSETITNIKSMWSNTANEIKTYIRDNENLSDEDRHYLYYILKSNKLWAQALKTQTVNETKKLAVIQISSDKKYLLKLLCRYTRKAKPKISHSTELKSMQLDTQMYSLDHGHLSIQTNKSRKRVHVDLKTKVSLTHGNIRIVLDKQNRKLTVHRCIYIPPNTTLITIKNELGFDKGYTVMLSCSSDHEYGECLGDLLSSASKFVNEKNKKRNQYHSDLRKLKKKLENKHLTDKERNVINEKFSHIEQINLSNKSYNRKRNRDKEIIRSYVNHEIKRMILTEKPSIIALEDLTFQSDSPKDKGKNFNRKMSTWIKGYIDERINYYAQLYDIKIVYVSAAYTSQFCAKCGARLEKRIGEHHEIGVCPNCGYINANTNAAKQVESRIHDKEITRYTNYKKVEQIMIDRYNKKLKKQQKSKKLKKKTSKKTTTATSC